MKHIFSICLGGFLVLTSCNSLSSAKSVKVWQRQDFLSERQVENLEALSSLYGYARYFYPNQQVAKFDGRKWNKFLVYATEYVIDAENNEALQERLKELFSPIIPEILFVKPIQNFSSKTKPFYCWEHKGIGDIHVEDSYYNKIKYFLNYTDSLPVSDSLYQFTLTKDINVYFPIAISYKHEKMSKDMKQLNKKINAIKFKLTSISDVSLLYKLIRNKDTYKYSELVFVRNKYVRIADIMIRWNIIQHFYPYYKEDGLDKIWNNALLEALQGAVSCNDQYEYYDVVRALFGNIKDSHIVLSSNACVSKIVGVNFPMYFPNIALDWCEDTIYIALVPDSLQSLISKGDKIVAVNDIPIDTLIHKKWNLIPASTKQAKYDALVRNQLLGCFKIDSVFNIKIQNEKQENIVITPKLTYNIVYPKNEQPYFIAPVADSIYCINITYRGADANYQTFKDSLEQLKKARGIIVDLRGYPNNVADTVITYFCKSPLKWGDFRCPIRYFPNQQNVIYKSDPPEYMPTFDYISTPVCFLINSKAISYAETLIEIIKRNKIGPLVGLPTTGTNGDMTFILSDNMLYTYSMTAIKDFSGYHGKGIAPDIYVSPTLQGIREGRDEIMEVALKYLKTK